MSNSIASLSYLLSIDTKQFTQGVVATRKDMSDLRRIMSDTATAEDELTSKLARIDELRKKFTTVPEERWQRAIKAVHDEYARTTAIQAELVEPSARFGKGQTFAGQKLSDALGLGEFVSAGQAAGPAGIAIAAGFATAAAGAAAFIAGSKMLADVTLQSIARLDDLADSAAALGVSASGLQTLQNAAMLADAPTEDLVNALAKMEDALGNPSDQTVAMLDKLGLSAEHLRELDPDVQFIKLAEAIDKLPTRAEKISAMRDIVGRVDVRLMNLIDNIHKFTEQAEKISLTDSQFEAIGNADTSLKMLNGSFTHLKDIVGVELAPVVVEVADSISAMLSDDSTVMTLHTSLIATRDVLLSIDDAAQGVSKSLDGIVPDGGNFGALNGALGPFMAAFNNAKDEAAKAKQARDEERAAAKAERDAMFTTDANGIRSMTPAEVEKANKEWKDQQDTERKRLEKLAQSMKDMRSQIFGFDDPSVKMRADAEKAGATTQAEIDAYVALNMEVERLKKNQEELKQAQQERSRLAQQDAQEYEKMVDSLTTKEEKAADQLKRFAELGATQDQIDAMASKLAEGLMPKATNQSALTGIQKGSKEDVATIAARNREERQLEALRQVNKNLVLLLKKDVVQVQEVSIP